MDNQILNIDIDTCMRLFILCMQYTVEKSTAAAGGKGFILKRDGTEMGVGGTMCDVRCDT